MVERDGAIAAWLDGGHPRVWIGRGPLSGDADGNGRVDDNDLSLLLANWGQDVTGQPDGGWARGEFDGLAPVQDNDLSLLLANWTGSGAIPEPATLGLLAVGAAILRRHKRHL